MVRGKHTIAILARGAAVIAALALILLVFLVPHASAVQRTQFDHLTTGMSCGDSTGICRASTATCRASSRVLPAPV